MWRYRKLSSKEAEFKRDDPRHMEVLHIEALRENPVFQKLMDELKRDHESQVRLLGDLCLNVVDMKGFLDVRYINGQILELRHVLGWLDRHEALLKKSLEIDPSGLRIASRNR